MTKRSIGKYESQAMFVTAASPMHTVQEVERSERERESPWPISGDGTTLTYSCNDSGGHVWQECTCENRDCTREMCASCELTRDFAISDIWRRFSD